jgi:hypothetical protein
MTNAISGLFAYYYMTTDLILAHSRTYSVVHFIQVIDF